MKNLMLTGTASPGTALFLREHRQGRVLMANSAGIYLELGEKLLLLCDEGWGTVPNGIGMAKFTDFAKEFALQPGDPVACRDGCLHFGPRWIKIAEKKEPAPEFGPRICREHWQAGLCALAGREKGLAPLAEPLLTGKGEKGRNPLCSLALPRLEMLAAGLLGQNPASLEEGVKGLLGLGPGLTPSGDDVLCGLLCGLLRSPLGDSGPVRALAGAVCREAQGRTHPVSTAFLQAAAGGASFGRLERAWSYLTGRGPECLKELLEVGSSSGGDCLLGLLLAGKICMERMDEGDGG